MNTINTEYSFANKRVIVMGLGRFGGGVGVTRWLINQGANVLVTDQADADTLASSIEQLADLFSTQRLEVVHGSHTNALLERAEVLIVNPAVSMPWKNPFINHARAIGVLVTTEIEIAYRQLDPLNIIAVTGSAGKSTTSAMIHHALKTIGRKTILAGNIGGSLLSQLEEIDDETTVVLELSSAMIYWLWERGSALPTLQGPQVACITNYMPNHLDWHGCETHYQDSKKQLISILPADSVAILDSSLRSWASLTKATVQLSQELVPDCATPGKHNAINAAMAVLGVFSCTQIEDQKIVVEAIQEFAGLPHRLNLCHCANDIKFYNDSKSTVPQATLLAVDAIAEHVPRKRIHLIVGGAEKGSDLSSIAALHDQLAGLYTIGKTGHSLAQGPIANDCQTLENAMMRAIKAANPGDVILLSPGCASWDQFTNYEQRGDRFVVLAKQLAQSTICSCKS